MQLSRSLRDVIYSMDHSSNLSTTTTTNKKTKKSSIAKNAASALDPSDHAALNRRAMRFQREHEIERQKSMGGHSSSSQAFRSSQFDSRSATQGYYGDDPEADPVCYLIFAWCMLLCRLLWACSERSELGSIHHRWDKPRSIQRLSTANIGESHSP